MFPNLRNATKRILAVGLALVTFVPLASARKVKPFQVLYDFCSQTNCSDGGYSLAGLIMDSSGNLYGTTRLGGNAGCGTLGCGVAFRLAPDGTETVLHRFCSQANCSDGSEPEAGLIMDGAGNLYGTTVEGGTLGCSLATDGCGTVFKIAPDGTETTLYTFCPLANCTDGANPRAGLIMDGAGNLYGTTYVGGANPNCNGGRVTGCGTVFKVSPGGTETVLYSFCSQANCSDGSEPWGGSLIFDGSGDLYGTTTGGGVGTGCGGEGGCGAVFRLAPDGTETVLYSFCASGNCSGGDFPLAGLIMDGAGNLYGTTADAHGAAGVVFELAPGGTETVLHTFTGGSDGAAPEAGVIMDSAGNLYGTTEYGGNTGCFEHEGCGTVFQLAPNGVETQLNVFKSQKKGVYPVAGLVADSQGNLYGTASNGGQSKNGPGVVYKINIATASKH